MTKRSKTLGLLALAAVIIAVCAWLASRAGESQSESALGGASQSSAGEPRTEGPALSAGVADARAREGIPGGEPAIPSVPIRASKAPAESWQPTITHVRGRALDLAGQPVRGLDVTQRSHPDRTLARTDANGSFEFEWRMGDLDLLASSPGFATVRSMAARGPDPAAGFLVVAPVVAVSGIVVDASGRGVEGADVADTVEEALMASFPLPLDTTMAETLPSAKSGPGGAFALPRSIAAAHVTLHASANGFAAADVPAPTAPSLDVRIVLKTVTQSARFVTGSVWRKSGQPATHAHVHVGEAETKTDGNGDFRLPVPELLHDSQALVAVESGSQAASIADFGRVLNASKDTPAPMRLVLGGAPLAISGHVVDAQKKPLGGWVVGLVHATAVTVGRVPPITAESLTTGSDDDIHTDHKGAFRIGGLLERDYHVFAYDPETLARIESGAIAAGTRDVELVLPADTYVDKVTGVVVGHDGSPIAGASVSIGMVTAQDEASTSWVNGTRTTSDARGEFALPKVPRHFVHIDVGGDPVLPKSFPLKDVDLERPLRLEIARRCHFRVEGLPASESVRWLGAYDVDGDELPLTLFQLDMSSTMNRQQITTDTTRVYAVAETAVELRLYDTYDHVAQKRPMHLVPNEVTVVTW